MASGYPPFYSEYLPTLCENILKHDLKPLEKSSKELNDLVCQLLEKDCIKRMKNFRNIISHPFFKDVDWEKMKTKSIPSPFIPSKKYIETEYQEKRQEYDFSDFVYIEQNNY